MKGTREGMTRYLEGCGYNVYPFANGQEAEDAIKEGLTFDIAIVDRSLAPLGRVTGVSGEDLISKIREISKDIPIICLTCYNIKEVRGADVVIDKQFNKSQLKKTIEGFVI